jgi:hypothetical protein
MRLDMIATAAAGPSMQIYVEDFTRSSDKNFLGKSQKKLQKHQRRASSRS